MPPRPPPSLGHDKPDDVDELSHARGLYPVTSVDQRQEGGAEDQGVLHREKLLQNGWSFRPTWLRSCGAVTGAIPDIPFIERKHYPLRRPPAGGHPISDSDNLIDVASDQIGFSHEVTRSVAVF